MKIKIGIVDDHTLVLESLIMLVNNLSNFEVTLHATDGKDLLQKLERQHDYPDILLVDVLMPYMEGSEVISTVKKSYPSIRLVALSVLNDSLNALKMIKAGCCAYLSKNINALELKLALTEIWSKGYYNSQLIDIENGALMNESTPLTDRELEFLELACSDLNYQQIAKKMFLSIKTIDGYRANLFHKFQVKSRTGLILEAIKRKLITVN
ncbi:response regulator transcription factor [Olivibacter domesticus]|uniref:Two component transcriptional regulator, LuxR family n=1 Tax=Olivibacter domesticus TaxID=407022 RepID=A0A1H7YZ92_OLID1|nr:response regulator transcription factor [Olivibacter domesticus]SEM51231.1 two component transcriptional regulator, LuxR family [Olivibacter domesticus]